MTRQSRAHARRTRSGFHGALSIALTALLAGAVALGGALPAQAMEAAPSVPTVLAADLSESDFSVTYGARVANGADIHVITVTLREKGGAPATGYATQLGASVIGQLGAGRIESFAEHAQNPGTYSAAITSTIVGYKSVSVTLAREPVRGQGNTLALFVAGPPELSLSTFSLAPSDLLAGEEATATIVLVDREKNPVQGVREPELSLTIDGASVIQSSTIQEIDAGRYQARVRSDVATQALIGARFEGQRIGQEILAVWSQPAKGVHHATLHVSAHDAVADGQDGVDVKVLLFDEDDVLYVGEADVEIFTTFGTLTAPTTRLAGDRGWLTSTIAGQAEVSFSLNGEISTQTEIVTFAEAQGEIVPPIDPEIPPVTPETVAPETAAPLTEGTGATALALSGGTAPGWPVWVLSGALGGLGILLLVVRRRARVRG